MSKGLNRLHYTKHFMAQKMCLRDLFGPIKGDNLTFANQDWTIEKCYMIQAPGNIGMMNYRIDANNEEKNLKVSIPVEDLTNNGWTWFVGKFPFELKIEELPGMFHVVDPSYQNTFDVRAADESHATAKAQALFQSDSPFLLVHKMFSVRALPSAPKMLSQLNRAIKSIPYGKGPLTDSVNHPEPISPMSQKSLSDIQRFQNQVEVLWEEFTGGTTWTTLGEGHTYSTEDFEILELCAEIDGAL